MLRAALAHRAPSAGRARYSGPAPMLSGQGWAHVIGHLGSRVSALLDGQLPPDEAERAWGHVHSCHACRDLVEREGWVKTRLRRPLLRQHLGTRPPQGVAVGQTRRGDPR